MPVRSDEGLVMDERHASQRARAWWEIVHHGRWGLLLILCAVAIFTGTVLAIDTYWLGYNGPPIPVVDIWPPIFFLGGLGGLDIYWRRNRARVNLAQGLMLLAFGSRILGLILGGVIDGWVTSAVVGLGAWVAFAILTQRAWSEVRSVL